MCVPLLGSQEHNEFVHVYRKRRRTIQNNKLFIIIINLLVCTTFVNRVCARRFPFVITGRFISHSLRIRYARKERTENKNNTAETMHSGWSVCVCVFTEAISFDKPGAKANEIEEEQEGDRELYKERIKWNADE